MCVCVKWCAFAEMGSGLRAQDSGPGLDRVGSGTNSDADADADADATKRGSNSRGNSSGWGSLTENGVLAAQLLKHLGGTSESITRLANGDVEDELLDAQLAHGVVGLFSLCGGSSMLAGGGHGDVRSGCHCGWDCRLTLQLTSRLAS